MARTIQSPGVEINERDISLIAQLPAGTNIFMNGYAPQGPSDELVNVTSVSEFEAIYGSPTNAAERYFYHSAQQVLNSPGNLLCTRLPYGSGNGSGFGTQYSALVYPITIVDSLDPNRYIYTARSETLDTITVVTSGFTASGSTTYTPITGSSMTVNVSSGGYILTDDGSGVLSAASLPVSGTVNYTNGAWTLDFTNQEILTNGTLISASYQTYIYDGDDTTTYAQATSYELGEPVQFTLTDDEYAEWESGQITWTNTPNSSAVSAINSPDDIGNAGLIIINELKTVVDDKYAGFYVAIQDNSSVADTTYTAVTSIQFTDPNINDWTSIPETRLEFQLTGTDVNDSYSEDVETVPSWDFSAPLYNDSLIITLHKIRPTTYGQLQNVSLTRVLTEAHTGSLDSERKWTPEFGEESYFLGTRINTDSTYMNVLVNPYIASRQGSWLDNDGLPAKQIRVKPSVDSAFAVGPYTDPIIEENRYIGNLPQKLERSLRLAENKEQIPIDVVCDAGLSTIWAAISSDSNGNYIYDDEAYVDLTDLEDQTTGSSSQLHNDWVTVFNHFETFVQDTRKDCLYVADLLRNIFVQGEDFRRITDPANNFSSNILWPIKNLTDGESSNYTCTYANWVKKYDNNVGDNVWLPFSAYAAKIMAEVDANLFPWWAPAGLNNGLIRDVVDIAIKPTQKQRDLLYTNSINPVVFFPGDGYAIWGQKTLQKRPSAFDRINVRRLFLTLEKATLNVMRYFVFEPNTNFTRTRVVNTLTPLFETARNNEGVYDYLIVCDERNNTPQVIDNNELVVDIYIKPVRAAEFILVNFIATRTDQDFSELV